MPLPDLCLLPHEAGDLAPGEPLCAPALLRVFVKSSRGEDAYLIRSLALADGSHILGARRENVDSASLLRLQNARNYATTLHIINTIFAGYFSRQLSFDAQRQLIPKSDEQHNELFLDALGSTYWIQRNGDRQRFVWKNLSFHNRIPTARRREMTDKQIVDDIHEMLGDTDSDCAFAWNWANLSHSARVRAHYRVARGTLEKVELLLHSVAWSESNISLGQGCHLVVEIASDAEAHSSADDARDRAERSSIEDNWALFTLSPQQTRVLELIFRHFDLCRNREFEGKTLMRDLWEYRDGSWKIPFSVPSMHQRLEAKLHLRDFLIDKVSPAELAELMDEN